MSLFSKSVGPSGRVPEAGEPVSRRVLVVDDDDDSRELYMELLVLAGHTVTSARDGEGALAAILNGNLDVAVLDVTIPIISGIEVARRARRALGNRTPYLLGISGHAPTSSDEGDSPFDAYFVKPVAIESILAAVAATARISELLGR